MSVGKCGGCCFGYLLAFIVVLTGTAFAAQKKPTTAAELALYRGADRQRILEEGARKEGKLTLYTVGIPQTLRPKVTAFEKRYPYIKVEVWRAGTTELVPKVFEEYQAGRHVVDIIELTQGGELALEERGIIQPFYSPNMAFIQENAIRRAPGGTAFSAGYYENGHSLGYNTKLVPKAEVPKTYQDLLDPKWKGKMAITSDMTGRNWVGLMAETYGEDFVRRLAKQDIAIQVLASVALIQMIANGEYALSPSVADAHVAESKKHGSPIDWVALEPVFINLGQVTSPKYPVYPHAAMLYIDFSLSRETGEIFKAKGNVSPRKDVPGGTTYKKYYGPYSTKQLAQWDELFSQVFLKK